MKHEMPVMNEETRQALIADCKAEIASLEVGLKELQRFGEECKEYESALQRQQIALASLEAKGLGYTNGHRLISEIEAKPSLDYAKSKSTKSGLRKVYDAPPVPVMPPVALPALETWRNVESVRAQNAYRILVEEAIRAAGHEVKS